MKRLAMAAALGGSLLLLTGPADAQWRYTDERGTTKITQYKIDMPERYRDAAEWIGPVGIGKPALSADQILAAQRWDAIQRIVNAEAGLLQYKNLPGPAPMRGPAPGGKPMATMCIAGELRAMTSPGSWRVVGGCPTGFSTDYGTEGYGTFGGIMVR